MFIAFTKTAGRKQILNAIIKGDEKWPSGAGERDVLFFLAQSFRARLLHDLPKNKKRMDKSTQYLVHRAKPLIKELAQINLELAQMVVSSDEGKVLPEWFMVEIVRDLPRLMADQNRKAV